MKLRLHDILLPLAAAVAVIQITPDASFAAKKKAPAEAAENEENSAKDTGQPAGCKASILMDAATGDVLAEKNPDMKLPPASMVKMMDTYLALKKIKEGVVNATDIVRASARASKVGGSQVYLSEGEEFTLEQMLQAVAIQSANDAATAIAEYIGGSVEGYVQMMNEEAQNLGMTNTVFQTPHGLPPAKGQIDDLTTPRDMATLARAIINEFPEALELTSRQDAEFRNGEFRMHNHNNLLRLYDGCDGMKTGFHNGAGFCITATAKRNNIRMITAVMGCNSIKTRTEEATRLMSQGFAQYRIVKLIDAGAPAGQTVAISGGKKKETMPVAAKKVTAMVRSSDAQNVTQKKELCQGLKAPVAKDTPCGSIAFVVRDKEVGRADMIINEEIPKATLTERMWNLLPW